MDTFTDYTTKIRKVTKLFSNTLSLRASINASDQVSHPYKTTGKITVLYILIRYALHILNNRDEYGPINDTMTLLKHIDKTTLLLPYEQLCIQSYQHHKQLIPEQHIGEHKPIYQLIYSLHSRSHPTTLNDQYSNTNTTKNQFHPDLASSQPT